MINETIPFIFVVVRAAGYPPITHAPPHVCPCVRPAPPHGRWLGFRIVSGLSVINMPGRVGPKKYITNRRGDRVHMEGRGWRRG